jgi:Flp pilus assembly protein TadG
MRRHALRSERGQALVEFALVAPLLLTLVIAIAQVAVAFGDSLALTDAVRTGARAAAVAGPARATAAAQQAIASSAADLDQAKVVVTVSATATDVTVTATYPYAIDVFGVVVSSGSLTSTTKEPFE